MAVLVALIVKVAVIVLVVVIVLVKVTLGEELNVGEMLQVGVAVGTNIQSNTAILPLLQSDTNNFVSIPSTFAGSKNFEGPKPGAIDTKSA